MHKLVAWHISWAWNEHYRPEAWVELQREASSQPNPTMANPQNHKHYDTKVFWIQQAYKFWRMEYGFDCVCILWGGRLGRRGWGRRRPPIIFQLYENCIKTTRNHKYSYIYIYIYVYVYTCVYICYIRQTIFPTFRRTYPPQRFNMKPLHRWICASICKSWLEYLGFVYPARGRARSPKLATALGPAPFWGPGPGTWIHNKRDTSKPIGVFAGNSMCFPVYHFFVIYGLEVMSKFLSNLFVPAI